MKERKRARSSPSKPRRSWWRRRPAEAAALAVASVAIIALIAVRTATSLSSANAPSPVPADVLAAGETIYADTCATCHGVEGEGAAQPGIPAPPLDGSAHSWHHSDSQIIGLIRDGGAQMPAVGAGWSDDEVEAVIAYVKTRWAPWQRESQPGTIGE
ncbi:MAG TPA: cytochrome c [Wenzhouxiangella sp.]|nr:cytochrome c [Wenzhouxiangella sp.]